VIGGLFNGHMQDKYGYKPSFISNIIQYVVAYTVMIVYIMNNDFSLWFAFVMNFAWGLQDSGVNVYSDCLCGFEFESETLPFTVLYFSQSMMCFIFTYIEAPLGNQKLNLIYFCICAVIGLAAWFFYWATFDHIDEKEKGA
jgi:MFS family permease